MCLVDAGTTLEILELCIRLKMYTDCEELVTDSITELICPPK